jgi:asparagine synthase (glutamine-hydrolysing)
LFYLNKLVSQHVKVVLSGQGADEPLGGYARYQSEIVRDYLPSQIWKSLRILSASLKRKERLYRALYSLAEPRVVNRFEKTYALFRNEEIDRLIGVRTARSREAIQYYYDILACSEKHPVEAMMSTDLRMNLSDDLLLLADKVSMHFSVEARVPMLDNDLVDFIESLPFSFRVQFGGGKLIHKKFAETCLPKRIVYRKKKGFQTPSDVWFRGEIGQKALQLLQNSARFSNYFNMKEVIKVFNDHKRGINREKQIFTLMSINFWMEEFL